MFDNDLGQTLVDSTRSRQTRLQTPAEKVIVVSIHRIRLLGPWEFEWIELAAKETPPLPRGTIKLPCRWTEAFGSTAGTVVFSRKFHCPTNLESHEHVFVVLSGLLGSAPVALNSEPLGLCHATALQSEFEVTKRLSAFNRLEIHITTDDATELESKEKTLTEVALEIRL